MLRSASSSCHVHAKLEGVAGKSCQVQLSGRKRWFETCLQIHCSRSGVEQLHPAGCVAKPIGDGVAIDSLHLIDHYLHKGSFSIQRFHSAYKCTLLYSEAANNINSYVSGCFWVQKLPL